MVALLVSNFPNVTLL